MPRQSSSPDHTVLERRLKFGHRVRSLRGDRSQTAVAAAAGMDRSFYIDVEKGRQNVSIDKVFQIADALGVPVRELFNDD